MMKKLSLVVLLGLLLLTASLPALAQEAAPVGEAGAQETLSEAQPAFCNSCGLMADAPEFGGELMPDALEGENWDAWIDAEIAAAADAGSVDALPGDGMGDSDWTDSRAFCPECGQRLDLMDQGDGETDGFFTGSQEENGTGIDPWADYNFPEESDESETFVDNGGESYGEEFYGEEAWADYNEESYDEDAWADYNDNEESYGEEAWVDDGGEFDGDAPDGQVFSLNGQELLVNAYTLLDEMRQALEQSGLPEAEGLWLKTWELDELLQQMEMGAQYE